MTQADYDRITDCVVVSYCETHLLCKACHGAVQECEVDTSAKVKVAGSNRAFRSVCPGQRRVASALTREGAPKVEGARSNALRSGASGTMLRAAFTR